MNYYLEYDVLSCAQHVEAKRLANKLFGRLSNLSDRIAADALAGKAVDGQVTKYNSMQTEFHNLTRGLKRCCAVH